MRRWQSSSAELVSVGFVALIVGIAAERHLFGFADVRHWLPDLLVGWILIGCGLLATGRPGALLALSGFAWFSGSFLSATLLLHRAPLAQLALTFPTGRAASRVERTAVAAAYGLSIATAHWFSDAGTVALGLALTAYAARNYVVAAGRRRRERLWALRASSVYAALLCALVILDIGLTSNADRSATLLAYELALVLYAVYLTVTLRQAPWREGGVTDLVVELGETRVPTLRDALARALGDPTLDVAFHLEDGSYVDADGRPLSRPADDPRRVTPLDREGREVAVLIHDPAVIDDRDLIDAVAAAARLTGANARLQAEVRTQLIELEASRRRLLAAGDDERRRLERRLHDGAVRRLTALGDSLTRIRTDASESVGAPLVRAQAQLELTAGDLQEFAAGLHPRELAERGLGAALKSLAGRSPIPVALAFDAPRLAPEIEATVFFVCSEALANVAKYARASRVVMNVRATTGQLGVEIADDGIGGARLEDGTGLRGLSDRVDAIGGTFDLDSQEGRGTRLMVAVPI